MDPRRKRAIVQRAVSLAGAITDTPPSEGQSAVTVGDDPITYLAGDAATQFEKLVQDLLKENPAWQESLTNKTIVGAIGNWVNELRKDKGKAEEHLDALIAQLDTFGREQIVYVPLGGIDMGDDPLQVGKVTLAKMTDSCYAELLSKIDAVIEGSDNTFQEKRDISMAQRQLLSPLRGRVCAQFRVTAEPDKARERALEETQRVLELLRFALPRLYEDDIRVGVGLLWELVTTFQIMPVLSTDGMGYSFETTAVGPLFPLQLTQQTIATMSALGVFEMATVLEKSEESMTEFERVLVRGIHWFANAQTQRAREDALLSLTICLETFFTSGDKSQPVMTSVAEGVAFILGQDLEQRKELKSEIKSLYNVRSDIAHGRQATALDSTVARLSLIGSQVIASLISRKAEFASKDDLLTYIENQRLS